MHLGFANPGFNSHSFATAVEPIIGSALFKRIVRSESKLQELLFLKALYLRPLVKNPSMLNKLVFGECGEPRFEAKLVPANLYHWSIDLESGGKVVLRSPSSSERNEPQIQALYFVAVQMLEFAESLGLHRLTSAFKYFLSTGLSQQHSGADSAIGLAFGGAVILALTKLAPAKALGFFEATAQIPDGVSPSPYFIKAASKTILNLRDQKSLGDFWDEALEVIPSRLVSQRTGSNFGLFCRLDSSGAAVISDDARQVCELSSQIVHRLNQLGASEDQANLGIKVLLGEERTGSPLSIFASDKGARLELPAKFVGATDGMWVVYALRGLNYDYEDLNQFLKVIELLPSDCSFWRCPTGFRFVGLNFASIARATNWHSHQEIADALALSLSIKELDPSCQGDPHPGLEAAAGFIRYGKVKQVDSRKIGYLVKAASYLKEVNGAERSVIRQLSHAKARQSLNFAAAALYFAELVESGGPGIRDSDAIKVLTFGFRNQGAFNRYYRSAWREASDFLDTEDEAISGRLLRAGILKELTKRVSLSHQLSEEESYSFEIQFIRGIFAKFGQDAESVAQEFWRARPLRTESHRSGLHQLQFDWNEGADTRTVEAVVDRLEKYFVQLVFEGVVQGVINPNDGYVKSYLVRKLKIDSPPYFTPKDPSRAVGRDYQRCFEESIEIGYSALDLYHGQSVLMFASRRCHPDRASQMEQFGQSCAGSSVGVEGRGLKYPGSGFIFNQLTLAAVFPQRELEGALLGLANLYPWAKDVLAEVGGSTLAHIRGFRLVLPPLGSTAAKIQGHDCALLSFQDHFGDPNLKGVFLVPRTAAQRLLEVYRQGDLDLSQGAEAVLRFITDASPSAFPPLCLSWISNLGGLCNAWPPSSEGLWEWERRVKGATVDFEGHSHKSYVLGEYQSEPNPAIEREFARFQAAHNEIYLAATNLFAMERLWRIAMARFSQGHFFGSEHGEDIYTKIGDIYYPKFGSYMLGRAINWNLGLRSRGVTDIDQYPVFVIANPLDHWRRPSVALALDTYSLKLMTPEGDRQFGITVSSDDELIWIERFWSKAESLGFEIRPEHRKRLGV